MKSFDFEKYPPCFKEGGSLSLLRERDESGEPHATEEADERERSDDGYDDRVRDEDE